MAKGGLKVKESVAAGRSVSYTSDGKARWEAPAATMAELADMVDLYLSTTTGTHRMVIDATRLPGRYNFQLWWSPRGQANGSAERPTLQSALESQLGLKLEPRNAPVEILVIDHVEKFPTEN